MKDKFDIFREAVWKSKIANGADKVLTLDDLSNMLEIVDMTFMKDKMKRDIIARG